MSSETSTPVTESTDQRNRQLARSTLIVMIAFALAKVISLGQTVLIAKRFGVGDTWDAYVAANKLPDLLFILISGGALSHAFIPIFSGYLARDDEDGAWVIASHVVNVVFTVTAIASVIVFFAAPWLVAEVIAPGFDQATQQQTVGLMRVLLIATLIFSVSGIVMGILHSFNHFLLPALAPIMLDLGILFGVIFLMPIDALGVYGVALGAVLGASLHLGIQIPGLIHFNVCWKPELGLRDPMLWRVIRLMLPRVGGLGVFHLNFIVMNNIASRLGSGSVSALDWGWKLMQIPETLIGSAMGIVIFPTLARLSERGDEMGKRVAMSGALRFILVASIPSAIALVVLGRPAISLLEGGAFDASASAFVYSTLQFFALGLIVHSALEVIARSFYADKDTFTPLLAALGGAAINLILSYILSDVSQVESFVVSNAAIQQFSQLGMSGQMGHVGGLALANSLGVMFEVGLLLIILRRRWHGVQEDALARTVLKATTASLVMALGIVLIGQLWSVLGWDNGRLLYTIAQVGTQITIGGMIFFLVAWILKAEELVLLSRMIRRRHSGVEVLA
jgi:putative peptidoglycan lipid II flippase